MTYFRPSAQELLKMPFFKKAKSALYLLDTVIPHGISLMDKSVPVCIIHSNIPIRDIVQYM